MKNFPRLFLLLNGTQFAEVNSIAKEGQESGVNDVMRNCDEFLFMATFAF